MNYGKEESVEPAPAVKPAKKSSVKLTDKQKADLTKHMTKVKVNMTTSEVKSHRMKMMSRMRSGMSIKKAHSDIMK